MYGPCVQQPVDDRHAQRLGRDSVPPLVVNMQTLESLLRERDWTVTRLAREMGMDRTSVSLTLAGKQRISREFELRLWRLFPRHHWSSLFTMTAAGRDDAAREVVA